MIDSCLQLGGRVYVWELEVAACLLPDRLQITSQITWQTSNLGYFGFVYATAAGSGDANSQELEQVCFLFF